MRIDIEAFPKHTFIGRENKNLPYTQGNEYYRVYIGNWFHDNTYGVYMTSDEYEGDDIDYCVFFPINHFKDSFTPDIPSLLFPTRGVRRHHRFRTRKRKKQIVEIKEGKGFVQREFQKKHQGKIYNFSFKCTCPYCQNTQGVRTEKRLEKMTQRMKEYREQDFLDSDAV